MEQESDKSRKWKRNGAGRREGQAGRGRKMENYRRNRTKREGQFEYREMEGDTRG